MSRSHATIGDAQAVRALNVMRTVANGLDKAHRSAMWVVRKFQVTGSTERFRRRRKSQ
jgi:hypothetical protein